MTPRAKTTTTPAEVRRRPLYILQQLEEKGARGIRGNGNTIADIAPDDPRRKKAREDIMNELETLALIVNTKWEKQVDTERDEQQTQRLTKLTSQDEATRVKWSKAGTKPLTVFPALGIGSVVGIADDGNVTRIEQNKILAMLGAGVAGTAGLAVAEGYCVLSVKAEDAHDVEMKYDLPKTLQWEAQGRICWAFSENTHDKLAIQAGCVAGDKVKFSACRHGGASVLVYAPIEKAKFIVQPKDALPAEGASLPGVPGKLLRLLNMVVRQNPRDVDIAIMN